MFTSLGRDVRFGLRSFLRDKGFALTAVLSIGLGVGANAAIFSLVNQALFRLLPVYEPDRLVLLDWRGSFIGKGWGSSNLMAYPFYQDLRDQTDVFDGVIGRAPFQVNFALDNAAESVNVELVTGSFFRVLGVRAFLGRTIEESDDQQPGASPVVVLSFDYWRNRLGGRSDIVGRTVLINTHPMTVIGVADAGFRGIDWGEVPSLWIPTMMKRQVTPDFDWLLDRRGRWLHVFGRLKPGMTAQQAEAALQPWFKRMLQTDTTREDWPPVTETQRQRYFASWLQVLPASHGRSDLRGRLERPLVVLLAATTLVLLLACLNVANLYLARSFARRRETALRLALGASRGRIVRELLVQSGMLAVGGALLGVAIAPAVIHALLSFLPADLATIDLSADISPTVFGFALAAALVTAVLFSSAPALRSARAEPSLTLKEESSTVGAGIAMRKVLVAAQIALALVLLIGAGLFVRTLATLRAKGPGFATGDLITFRIDTASNGYSVANGRALVRNVFAAVRTLPEVQHAALSTGALLAGGSWNQLLTVDSDRRFVTDAVVHCNAISPGFFATLGVSLTAGRDFTERDADENPPVVEVGAPVAFRAAIINESMARRYFGNRNPIGARLGMDNRPDTKTDVEIIGVVRTFSYRGVRETEDQAFFPYFQMPIGGAMVWARTKVPATAAFGAIRAAVNAIDPAMPVRPRTMDDQLDRSLANERLLAMLASAFAGLAILLALVGVYGVMSFVVSHRTREIGIRVALGASRANAVWLILREAAVMLSCGLLIALPAARALGRLIESQLFGVTATDLSTTVAAALVVACVALTASALPVRRATAISPIRALRGD
jgi:putative ABC transport system permease protein